MYQFSRAIYREVADLIETGEGHDRDAHEKVLRACEQTLERLAFDRHYFANPTRPLSREIRVFFPVTAQDRVLQAVRRFLAGADEWLRQQPVSAPCRATTRRGTPCPRPPRRAPRRRPPGRAPAAAAQRVLPVAPAPGRDGGARGHPAGRLTGGRR